MKTRFKLLAAALVAAGLIPSASAQPAGQTNYFWSAGGDKTTWSQPANWSAGIVPVNDGTTFQIFLGTGYPTPTPTPITLSASDHIILNDQVFGPEWGETFNIYGTVQAGFGFAPVGAIGGPISTINIRGNGAYNSLNSVFIGDMFWFNGGPNVNFNLYDNAQLNTGYLAVGGHLNLYSGIATVTNALLTGTPTAGQWGSPLSTDGTRQINIVNGMLILPGGSTAQVQDLISRGVFLAYGKANDTNDLIIDEANTNYPGLTVVTGVPLGALQAIHLTVAHSLFAGAFASADVLADYTSVSNCVVTHWPVSITYTSSATGIATVNSNGQVHAVSPGTATITARMGGFSSSVVLTVASAPVSLIHRYSFSESSGTTASDSIGGVNYAGTLNGGATFGGGQVTLDGTNGYVQLPPGILTNLSAVTIETWASFAPTIPNWGVLFTFGDTDSGTGNGMNYISCQPHTGFATTQIGISDADPGFNHELDAVFNAVLDGQTNVHIVAVYYPAASYSAIYTNGVLAAINSSITISLAAAFATGDPLNYIGHSLYANDPYFGVSVDEFRIYNGPLQAPAIRADAALGPNQLIGTATNVSLSVSASGGNVTLSWPATSALVNLQSSSALGQTAVWTSVSGTLSISGGNYQITIPAGGRTQFFRLGN